MSFQSTSRIPDIIAAMRLEAGVALLETAGDVLVEAAINAPVNSGDLQESYQQDSAIEVVSDTRIAVGTDIGYAPDVEFGTSRAEAQPHFVPAFVHNKENFKGKLNAAAGRAVS